jgi:hypothetical protein
MVTAFYETSLMNYTSVKDNNIKHGGKAKHIHDLGHI